MVQLDPILQPGDLRSWDTDRHAEERDLSAQHVIQLKVGGLHDLGTLRKTRQIVSLERSRTDTQVHRILVNSHLCSRNSSYWQDFDEVSGYAFASRTIYLVREVSLYLRRPSPLLCLSLGLLIGANRAAGISSFDL